MSSLPSGARETHKLGVLVMQVTQCLDTVWKKQQPKVDKAGTRYAILLNPQYKILALTMTLQIKG